MKISSVRFSGIFTVLLLGLSICSAACAQNDNAVSIRNDPDLSDLHIQLQALVNTLGFHKENQFCVVGYEGPKKDDPVIPYVYWPTQNKFIIDGYGSNMLLDTTDYFDLKRDILPNGLPIPPQDYILPWRQSDVDAVIQDCRLHGNSYNVTKTVGGWIQISQLSQFSTVNEQLQYLVDKTADQERNEFCVIGQKDATFLAAYVYWQTEDRLFLWLPSQYDKYDAFSVKDAPFQVDLKHGLRDEEDAEDSRNEMQSSYADAILKACRLSGQSFIVNKDK